MAWTKWLFRVEESLDKESPQALALACIETRECRIIFIAAVFIGDENNIMKETNSV